MSNINPFRPFITQNQLPFPTSYRFTNSRIAGSLCTRVVGRGQAPPTAFVTVNPLPKLAPFSTWPPLTSVSLNYYQPSPNLENIILEITYYEFEDDETPQVIQLQTDNVNEVVIGTMYRLVRAVCIGTTPTDVPFNQGAIYFFISGTPIVGNIPTDYQDVIEVNSPYPPASLGNFGNVSETAKWYTPPGENSMIESVVLSVQDVELFPTGDHVSVGFKIIQKGDIDGQQICLATYMIGNGHSLVDTSLNAYVIPERTDIQIICISTDGVTTFNNVNCSMNIISWKI